MTATRVAIAIGSNLGTRDRFIREGCQRLSALLTGYRASPAFDTAPVGVVGQPRFLNAAVTGLTTLPPRVLLEWLLETERTFGRVRLEPLAPRTLDLDLVLYGDRVIQEPGLIVPHPRFRERRFVLEPLAMIAPDMPDPVTGLTVVELLARLPR